MKTKRFNKKLHLNKKTIADLNGSEMKDVNGGGLPPLTPYTCLIETCHTECATCQVGCTDGCCTQGTSAGGFCC